MYYVFLSLVIILFLISLIGFIKNNNYNLIECEDLCDSVDDIYENEKFIYDDEII